MGFVIRADTEESAREMAESKTIDEFVYDDISVNPWLNPNHTICIELTIDGDSMVIIRDFYNA
jgi:hypothetical protein